MANKIETLQLLNWRIRRLFQQLTLQSAELLEDLEINPSQRAVLEFLSRQERQTVPDIARQYQVSRQHIQQIVNELQNKGLVETTYNPAHKRSVFIQRTQAGCAVFETVQQRENAMLNQISRKFKLKDLQVTLRSLDGLSEWLRRNSNNSLTGSRYDS